MTHFTKTGPGQTNRHGDKHNQKRDNWVSPRRVPFRASPPRWSSRRTRYRHAKRFSAMPFDTQSHHFTKTGSGQTQGGTTQKERCVALQAELTAQLTTLRQKASLDLAHASAGEKPASVLIAAGGSGRGVGFVTALISIDAKNEHLTKTGSGQTGQASGNAPHTR